jgi:homoserine O-acetyltransferase/O-succinyltransferase
LGAARAQDSSAIASRPAEEVQQADAWYEDYRFRSGETLPKLRLHPHRDASDAIDNAVLMLHWAAVNGGALLTPEFVQALYGRGLPLDAQRFFLIFLMRSVMVSRANQATA